VVNEFLRLGHAAVIERLLELGLLYACCAGQWHDV
jgi:hypothetical protein